MKEIHEILKEYQAEIDLCEAGDPEGCPIGCMEQLIKAVELMSTTLNECSTGMVYPRTLCKQTLVKVKEVLGK